VPNSVPDQPYAYLSFGEGGAYLPVVLVTKDVALTTPVSAAKAGLPGIDVETSGRLRDAGLTVDSLAGAWKGLLTDHLQVSATPQAAASLGKQAEATAISIKGSPLTLTSVTPDLANADVNQVAAKLAAVSGVGQTYATSLAQRMIDEARLAVPMSDWSVRDATLGLSNAEIASLEAGGLMTKGQLKAAVERAQSEGNLQQVADSMAIAPQRLTAISGGITIRSADAIAAEGAASGSTAVLDSVSLDLARDLASRAGISTVGELASARPEAIAPALGGNLSLARSVIAEAQNRRNLNFSSLRQPR
jgi:hypothetical protein